MRPTTAKLVLICVLAAADLLASDALQLGPAGGSAGASCIPRERDALLSFKRGITSDPMGILDSWHKEDSCQWRGVKCSNRTDRVLRLHLRNVLLDGFYGDTALVGEISNSLLSMDRLVHLDLSMNCLEGPSGHIPEFLASLTGLRYLNLSGIPFFGRVPPHLGNLSNLRHLDLSCQFQSMYSRDISWIARIPNLQYLRLNSVNLSTIADWPYVVNMIPSLKALDLGFCYLPTANHSLPHINLTKLERLDLSGNTFAHLMARGWFWNLTSLQDLYLSETQLYGQPPDALAHMTSLRVLDFSSNHNMGTMTTSFRKLCNLRILDLSFCQIVGNIKDIVGRMPQCPLNKLHELYLGSNNITRIMPDQIPHLTSLVILDIARNNLIGGIPRGVGLLSRLRRLDLSSNNLSGSVPSEIGMLSNLTMMDLTLNNLNGDFTEEHLTSLTRLRRLHLRWNYLRITVGPDWIPPFSLEEITLGSCQLGPLFPAWLQFQVDIRLMDISSTGIVDRIPHWFSTTFAKVTDLDISNNEISGRLPINMEFMSLQYFSINSNNLTGELPNLPTNITSLDMSRNSLSGTLPSNIGTPHLISLALVSNQITGSIPESLCKAEFLESLDLRNNLLEGQLPWCFGVKDISFLMLSNNSFSGNFPPFVKDCRRLEALDLSRNSFSGRLPLWIGDLVELRFLRLNQNMFSGEIPATISNLSHLHHLNLAGNGLSGPITWHLSNVTGMTGKYVKDYMFDSIPYGSYSHKLRTYSFSSVVVKGRELDYDIHIMDLVSIDLSFNQLTGRIPEEIVALDALIILNLSWNQLSGKIPNKLGALHALESLDLSRNMLSGRIPPSLSDITYLSYLNLSDNNLTGRIPSGHQLDTLYTQQPSMYSGNSGLCGPPLPNSCPGKNVTRQDDQKRNEHSFEPMTFYFGLALGFVLGLWVVFCVLLFKREWRTAYFCMVDKTYDQMYVFAVLTWKSWTRKRTTN
ncbi:receptor-like protein EIX2 [Triticum urartu]|nr:receptor-like protein EIX2 [Triticum aestivum]XP_048543555.1 receptor-like protein EIX2 [Triticum urartu]